MIAQVTNRLSSLVATHYINIRNSVPGYQTKAANKLIGDCMQNVYLFSYSLVTQNQLLDKVNQDLNILEKLVYSI